jgi:hypothetical protein
MVSCRKKHGCALHRSDLTTPRGAQIDRSATATRMFARRNKPETGCSVASSAVPRQIVTIIMVWHRCLKSQKHYERAIGCSVQSAPQTVLMEVLAPSRHPTKSGFLL